MALTQVSRGLLNTSIVDNGNATAITIDSSENVGIGNSSPDSVLTAVNAASTAALRIGLNNTSFNYMDADNNIFRNGAGTERIRINSSGNVGVGITDPTDGHLVLDAGQPEATLLEYGASTTNRAVLNSYYHNDGGVAFTRYLDIASVGNPNGNVAGSAIRFLTQSIDAAADAVEAMRIDSSGNVGIGTTSPASLGGGSLLTVDKGSSDNIAHFEGNGSTHLRIGETSGAMYLNANNGVAALAFQTNGSEKMRLDSSGRLLIAMTSADDAGGTPSDVNGTEIGKGYINLNRDDTASINQIQFGKNGSVAGRITTTTTTSYVETSDRRVKSNIADAEDCGTAIDLMQVRKFDWTESGEHHPFGMIAQELLQVAPIAVDAPDDPNEMMGIDYSKLVPMLVKEIQSLRARVQQLENN